jgi:hypothetical protein
MRTKFLLVVVGLLLSLSTKAAAKPTNAVIYALSAIDKPLSRALLETEQVSIPDLLDLVYDAALPLYVRGRAIAAIGLIDGANAPSTLMVLLRSPILDGLRVEALLSLMHHPEKPTQQELTMTLSEVLPAAGDALYPVLLLILERL